MKILKNWFSFILTFCFLSKILVLLDFKMFCKIRFLGIWFLKKIIEKNLYIQ